jgi:hypothetical protein
MSAFVQQFLYDVATTVDPFGYVADGIRQVGRAPRVGGLEAVIGWRPLGAHQEPFKFVRAGPGRCLCERQARLAP